MPEAPNFEEITREIAAQAGMSDTGMFAVLADTLRVVWNARGAADTAKIEAELSSMMGEVAAEPYVTNLNRALRGLDQ